MSNTRFVGAYPDHVTRYNHKGESRWMTPPRPYRSTDTGTAMTAAVLVFAFAVMIAVGVMILQAV